jgi:hypothetical protein
MSDALDDGALAATEAIEPLTPDIESLPQVDRERWWSGFMVAANAMAAHSVGPDMALMISRACCELSAEEMQVRS